MGIRNARFEGVELMSSHTKRFSGYRMTWSEPRHVRAVMLLLWSVFVFGSCAVAGVRFAMMSATFETAFGNLPGSLTGFTIGTGVVIGLSYLTKKIGPASRKPD